jgi:hydrogenase nickel incorporation protein HypA/HybF
VQPNSLARSLFDFVSEQIAGNDLAHERVSMVRIRMGDLCGVAPADVKDAFSAIVIGTPLQNCRLEIEPVDLMVFCPHCHKEQPVPDIHALKCPECGAPTPRVVQGRELEIAAIETNDMALSVPSPGNPACAQSVPSTSAS